jgi:hypothetical protein
MKEVIIIILLLCIVNTFLLLKHMYDMKKHNNCEGYFETDRTSTRYGPYDGITSCSGIGVRNVYKQNRPIGDDSFIFNGPKSK